MAHQTAHDFPLLGRDQQTAGRDVDRIGPVELFGVAKDVESLDGGVYAFVGADDQMQDAIAFDGGGVGGMGKWRCVPGAGEQSGIWICGFKHGGFS